LQTQVQNSILINEQMVRLDSKYKDFTKKKNKQDLVKKDEIENTSVKTIYYDFWLHDKNSKELETLNEKGKNVIISKLGKYIKKFINPSVENDLK
jgi:hypothetical protein